MVCAVDFGIIESNGFLLPSNEDVRMSFLDWSVLIGTLLFIVAYGTWKNRKQRSLESYMRGDNTSSWWAMGLSVMATQASAITFLSTPGQAYTDGMRFLQFYFGLPLAMIVLSITFIPIFYRLKVFTAYEFLESRFDLKTRLLAAGLFLVQRGLAAGITIYAPSIILSTLLDWPLTATNIFLGLLVIVYTVSGGSAAVTQTQKQQMAVMMGGMVVAGIMVMNMLPPDIGLDGAMHIAGQTGKLNLLNFEFDLNDRYNIWSGMLAAFFLFMSYFGTDQSQVQRYLSGKSMRQSQLGLMMNGLLKVPMQFMILMIGVFVFVFYQFNRPPVFFNQQLLDKVANSEDAPRLSKLEAEYTANFEEKQSELYDLVNAQRTGDAAVFQAKTDRVKELLAEDLRLRDEVRKLVKNTSVKAETNDKDYIFMRFVMDYLPIGLVGLLFAVMFSAAMSSTSSELNALGTTTTIDIYKRTIYKEEGESHYVNASKWFTFGWGLLAILFATAASLFENLIQAVNLLGSLFYGTILGIFLAAFYVQYIGGRAVFVAALLAEAGVLLIHWLNTAGLAPVWLQMSFLWYNVVGCLLVIGLGIVLQRLIPASKSRKGEVLDSLD